MAASIGIAVTDNAEDQPEVLLREADLAMYRAKRAANRHDIHCELQHRDGDLSAP